MVSEIERAGGEAVRRAEALPARALARQMREAVYRTMIDAYDRSDMIPIFVGADKGDHAAFRSLRGFLHEAAPGRHQLQAIAKSKGSCQMQGGVLAEREPEGGAEVGASPAIEKTLETRHARRAEGGLADVGWRGRRADGGLRDRGGVGVLLRVSSAFRGSAGQVQPLNKAADQPALHLAVECLVEEQSEDTALAMMTALETDFFL